MKILRTTIILTLLLIGIAEAHQPRIVYDRENTGTNPILITAPETSRAYYGELKGREDNYMIINDDAFMLYLNILTPFKLQDNRKDFFVEVRDFNNRQVLLVDGTKAEWNLYFEEFGRDYYLKGPEERKELPGGIYYMNISSTDNQGKYTLAIGEEESYPINEVFRAYYTVPKIKREFFGERYYKLFLNPVGFAAAITLIILLFIIWFGFRLRKIAKQRRIQEKKLPSWQRTK